MNNSLDDVHRESVKAVMRLMKKEINERKKSAGASEQKGEASSNEFVSGFTLCEFFG